MSSRARKLSIRCLPKSHVTHALPKPLPGGRGLFQKEWKGHLGALNVGHETDTYDAHGYAFKSCSKLVLPFFF